VVFDESVFPFSTATTPPPEPDLSSLFPTDTVVQPLLPFPPVGTAPPCPSPGPCPSSPPTSDAPGPVSCPGPAASPSDATGPGSSISAPPARFAQPVHVYQRRAQAAPLPQPPQVASSSPQPPTAPMASSSLGKPTPPLRQPAGRVVPQVYHPPLLHRHPRHVHPMVTQHAAGTLRSRALAVMPGDTQVSCTLFRS
jgi:hypothetical protein